MTERAHETRDLPPRGILFALGGVFVLIAATGLGVAALLHGIERHTRPPSLAPFPPQSRAGRPLEVDPGAEREALEADARQRLATYGWTDRDRGIARIPVERAMVILAAHGWPDPEAPER